MMCHFILVLVLMRGEERGRGEKEKKRGRGRGEGVYFYDVCSNKLYVTYSYSFVTKPQVAWVSHKAPGNLPRNQSSKMVPGSPTSGSLRRFMSRYAMSSCTLRRAAREGASILVSCSGRE